MFSTDASWNEVDTAPEWDIKDPKIYSLQGKSSSPLFFEGRAILDVYLNVLHVSRNNMEHGVRMYLSIKVIFLNEKI